LKLYLMQHGEAVWEEHDPTRPLTEKGRADAERVVRYAVEHAGVSVGRILHSGKLRAQQTAEIWREHLPTAVIADADGLDPTASPDIWSERLVREVEDLVLVGHRPHLARLAGRLLCGDSAREVVNVQNGGVVCLERSEHGAWSACWALTPEII
jgi:phosphohistidine phosphatase